MRASMRPTLRRRRLWRRSWRDGGPFGARVGGWRWRRGRRGRGSPMVAAPPALRTTGTVLPVRKPDNRDGSPCPNGVRLALGGRRWRARTGENDGRQGEGPVCRFWVTSETLGRLREAEYAVSRVVTGKTDVARSRVRSILALCAFLLHAVALTLSASVRGGFGHRGRFSLSEFLAGFGQREPSPLSGFRTKRTVPVVRFSDRENRPRCRNL